MYEEKKGRTLEETVEEMASNENPVAGVNNMYGNHGNEESRISKIYVAPGKSKK